MADARLGDDGRAAAAMVTGGGDDGDGEGAAARLAAAEPARVAALAGRRPAALPGRTPGAILSLPVLLAAAGTAAAGRGRDTEVLVAVDAVDAVPRMARDGRFALRWSTRRTKSSSTNEWRKRQRTKTTQSTGTEKMSGGFVRWAAALKVYREKTSLASAHDRIDARWYTLEGPHFTLCGGTATQQQRRAECDGRPTRISLYNLQTRSVRTFIGGDTRA